jgi:hypothetical protein
MADLTGAVSGGTGIGDNYLKNKLNNGLGARTIIVKLAKTDITDAELNTAIAYITSADGSGGDLVANGSDAFTVVGMTSDGGDTGTAPEFVSGESDEVHLAVQGTGTLTKAGIEANDGSIGFTATIVATFDAEK